MGRPRKNLETVDHSFPSLAKRVRLLRGVRGASDRGWHVQILGDNGWIPSTPAGLGTRDLKQAEEEAFNRWNRFVAGKAIGKVPPKVPNRFAEFAEEAIANLTRDIADLVKLGEGKAHTKLDRIRRIRRDLIPAWGDRDITQITDSDLNDWIEDDYLVIDKHAGKVDDDWQMKAPAESTLRNLDAAFRNVWLAAVKAKVVEKRHRPKIDCAEHGENGETRAFIERDDVIRLNAHMSDAWVASAKTEQDRDRRYILRAYCALLAATGIRAGLEAKRIRLGDIQQGRRGGEIVRWINIQKRQGKHPGSRIAVVNEAMVFPVGKYLPALLDWQRARGAKDTDYIFDVVNDGVRSHAHFAKALTKVLIKIGIQIEPMTGKMRCAYSFRHFFATELIYRRKTILQISSLMGTGPQMIEKHYNHYLALHEAREHAGISPMDRLRAGVEQSYDPIEHDAANADWIAQRDLEDDGRPDEELDIVAGRDVQTEPIAAGANDEANRIADWYLQNAG